VNATGASFASMEKENLVALTVMGAKSVNIIEGEVHVVNAGAVIFVPTTREKAPVSNVPHPELAKTVPSPTLHQAQSFIRTVFLATVFSTPMLKSQESLN